MDLVVPIPEQRVGMKLKIAGERLAQTAWRVCSGKASAPE